MGRLHTGSLLSFFGAPQDQHAILPGGFHVVFSRWSDGSNFYQKNLYHYGFFIFLKFILLVESQSSYFIACSVPWGWGIKA